MGIRMPSIADIEPEEPGLTAEPATFGNYLNKVVVRHCANSNTVTLNLFSVT